MVYIDMSLLALKTLRAGRTAQTDVEKDLDTSAGATGPAALMTFPSIILWRSLITALSSTIPQKRCVTASFSSSESSFDQSYPPST